MTEQELNDLTLKVALSIKARNPEMSDKEAGRMAKEIILETLQAIKDAASS